MGYGKGVKKMDEHEDMIFDHLYGAPPRDQLEREAWEIERVQVLGKDIAENH